MCLQDEFDVAVGDSFVIVNKVSQRMAPLVVVELVRRQKDGGPSIEICDNQAHLNQIKISPPTQAGFQLVVYWKLP